MRITPQDLGGNRVNRPVASPTDQFALQGPDGGPDSTPVSRELVDLRGLSATLAGIGQKRREIDEEVYSEVGDQVASLKNQGLSDDEILKKVIVSGKTPARIAADLRKATSLDEVDNPAFQMGLQSRRADIKVALYETAANASVESLAAQLQGADPSQKVQIVEDALAALREENAELFENAGVFGGQAIEQGLRSVHERFAQKADALSRDLQKSEYRRLINESLNAVGAAYSAEADEDGHVGPQARQDALTRIGAEYDKTRLEGNREALKDIAFSTQAAAAQISLEQGSAAAATFLEEALFGVKSASGDKIFDNDPGVQRALVESIQSYERAAERESQTRSQKAGARRTEVNNIAEGSDGAIKLASLASEDGTRARTAFKTVRDAVIAGDPEVLEEFGVEEKDKGYLLGWLRGFEGDMVRNRRTLSADAQQSARDAAIQRAFDSGDTNLGVDILRNLGVNPSQWSEIQLDYRRMVTAESQQVFNTLQQIGASGSLHRLVDRSTPLGADGRPDLLAQERKIASLRSRYYDWLTSDATKAAISGDPLKAQQMLDSFLLNLEKEPQFTPLITDQMTGQQEPVTALGVGGELNPQRAADRIGDAQRSAMESFRPQSQTISGGIVREEAPSAYTRLHDITTDTVDLDGFNKRPVALRLGPKELLSRKSPSEKVADRMGRVFQDESLPLEVREATVTEAALRSGVMSIQSGVNDQYRGHFGSVNDEGEFESDFFDTPDLVPDTSSTNPYSVRFRDFADVEYVSKWIRKDSNPLGSGDFVLTNEFPSSMRDKVEAWLSKFSIAATPTNVSRFVQTQRDLWAASR